MTRPVRLATLLFLAVFSFLAGSVPAAAQTTYAGAFLTGDIVRTSHSEVASFDYGSGGGEAFGFAVRLGRAIGSNWGVELEYARPAMIEHDDFPIAIPAIAPSVYPIPISIETRERYSTFSTVAWVNQQVSSRVALVYLGGIGFNRLERENAYDIIIAGDPTALSLLPSSRSIEYSTRPVAGFESWVGLNDRLTFVSGVRLHGVTDGILVRLSAGVSWSF